MDGAEEPVWVVPAYDLMRFGITGLGRGLLQPHTSYTAGVRGGSTLYLPIPYARRCVVALEEPAGISDVPRYYQFNYRTYAPGTEVESFSLPVVQKYTDQILERTACYSNPTLHSGAAERSPEASFATR